MTSQLSCFTFIHVVDPLNITNTHCSSLSHKISMPWILRSNGILVIRRKRLRVIVHDGVNVVSSLKVSEIPRVDFLKVVICFRRKIRPPDCNKFITVDVAVHVVIAESVNELVLDRSL